MFGFVSKRKADAMAAAAVGVVLGQVDRELTPVMKKAGDEVRAEREALTKRAEEAEARCKALERRLDGWVPADQASSLRWRIAELEAQVVEIRAAAGVYKTERDELRDRLAAIALEDDAKTLALFRPGLPVGFEPAGKPLERVAD